MACMKRTEGAVWRNNANEREIDGWMDFPMYQAKICPYGLIVSCSLDS